MIAYEQPTMFKISGGYRSIACIVAESTYVVHADSSCSVQKSPCRTWEAKDPNQGVKV